MTDAEQLARRIQAHIDRASPEGDVFDLYPDEQPIVLAALALLAQTRQESTS